MKDNYRIVFSPDAADYIQHANIRESLQITPNKNKNKHSVPKLNNFVAEYVDRLFHRGYLPENNAQVMSEDHDYSRNSVASARELVVTELNRAWDQYRAKGGAGSFADFQESFIRHLEARGDIRVRELLTNRNIFSRYQTGGR